MALQFSVPCSLFLYTLTWFFVNLIASIHASMQIIPCVLYIIMFHNLAVEIKIYLKVFRKIKDFRHLL